MATKDYTSVYSIKDWAMKELFPKYFEGIDANTLNVGLLGYSNELIANTTEDTFNAFSTFIREIFPNISQFPETLYNNAARLQIDNLFATPSVMNTVLFINEADVLKYGLPKGDRFEFTLDSDLIVDVQGKQFMMDYDVKVSAKPYRGDYIYTAVYDVSFKNSLSGITNPYIKTRRVKIGTERYVGLIMDIRRVNKFEQQEFIINNDKINLPILTIQFNDQLANFEVFYKPPGAATYSQLTKRLFNTTPLKDPFCFYRIKDTNKVEISFTLRDNYFQPVFNSEILIRYYNTTGAKGNFPLFKGDVKVLPKSHTYDYNNNIIVFGVPQTESKNGKDPLTLEELRSLVIELSSVAGAYSNENDLQMYFANFKIRNNTTTDVLFVKRRDDALLRLFSAFSVYRDLNGDVYPTNTTNMQLSPDEIDTLTISTAATTAGSITITLNGVNTTVNVAAADTTGAIGDKIRAIAVPGWVVGGTAGSNVVTFTKVDADITITAPVFSGGTTGVTGSFVVKHSEFDIKYAQSDKFILKPGHLFKFQGNSVDTVEMIIGKNLKDDITTINEPFLYTNPFLMTVTKSPTIVGFYLNSIDKKLPLDYTYVNSDSIVQFICNNVEVKRNALIGEDSYVIQLVLLPATDATANIVNPTTGADLGNVKIMGAIEDSTGMEMCYHEFTFKSHDKITNTYTYEAKITTDDYMTLNQGMRVLNGKDMMSGMVSSTIMPMNNCKINFYTFYKYPDQKLSHKFDYMTMDYQPFSMTNTFSTDQNRIDFITPLNTMRSKTRFVSDVPPAYHMILSFVPLIKAATMKVSNLYSGFIDNLFAQYASIQDAINKVTNNFGVDMKFYNTYGRSKNFKIGDTGTVFLDKVNLSIHFKIAAAVGVVDTDLVRDLKIFIKNYIEVTSNDKGYNSVYISNLITTITENFSDRLKHIIFVGINNYDSLTQVLENGGVNLDKMTKDQVRNFVPEYLTLNINDIIIDIIATK